MLRLPIHLAKVAMLGAAPLGGGFASRAVSYAAGSQLRDTARQHLPGWAGGQPTSSNEQTAQAESRTGTRLRQAATLAGASATGGATGAAAAAAGGGASTGNVAAPAGRPGRPPPVPAPAGTGARTRRRRPRRRNAAGQAGQGGLQTPSFREQDFANETFEARFRERTSPVSAEQATAALEALPADTQRGIGQLVSEHGAGAREHLAYQAMGEWSSEEREALRTLAAASPEIRAQALGNTAETGDQQRWLDARGRHESGCGRRAAAKLRAVRRPPRRRRHRSRRREPGQPEPVRRAGRPAGPERASREPGDGLLTATRRLIGAYRASSS